jgi:hypothetical protein
MLCEALPLKDTICHHIMIQEVLPLGIRSCHHIMIQEALPLKDTILSPHQVTESVASWDMMLMFTSHPGIEIFMIFFTTLYFLEPGSTSLCLPIYGCYKYDVKEK